MEVKLRIIDIYPKIQTIKNNPKDIISISFITSDYSTKIADIEQSMTKNEKFIFKLKSKNSKNQIFKCLLLRNINNIICSGEFILEEGLSWYKLNEIKNNTMSKESLITSSTSKGNILNTNGNISQNLDLKSHYLSDINLKLENNINLANKNHNSKKYENIKIKLMVNYIKRISTNKYNINNTLKEQGETSLRERESSYDKKNDNFESSICDMDISKINSKVKMFTTNKKNSKIRKSILFGNQTKISSKKKINFNYANKSLLSPIASIENIIANNNKETSYTINNYNNHNNSTKSQSIKKYIKDIKTHKNINETIKMKTSFNFYRKKINLDNNKYSLENKITQKNSSKKLNHHKLNSCENFEDKILDQNFKNYLKNDENLKANLSRNDSFTTLNQIDITRHKDSTEINNNNEIDIKGVNSDKIIINSDINNNFYENYERLKIDFLLLYSEENLKNINNEDYFLETQLMLEKLLKLQHFHQKEYIQILNSIKSQRKKINQYKIDYLLISKKSNKLNLKKLEYSLNKNKNEINNETVSNFIKVRKKLIKDSEIPIWNKLMTFDKSSNIDNSKNKMINIFLNICSKRENKLNKLSLKFYNEIKNKKNNQKTGKNKSKNIYKNIGEKKISIETKISTNLYENHFPNNKTSKNSQYNTNIIPSSRGKNNVTSKKHSALRIINNKNSFNNKIIINETATNNNYNINKLNHKIKQPNSGIKFYTSKKYVNKNQ